MKNLFTDILNDTVSEMKTVFDLIRERTPIDTGAARASYKFDVQAFSRNETVIVPFDVAVMKQRLSNDELSLNSTCDYLGKLEAGFSKQAPFGFIQITLMGN